ncbi:MAG TPA: hypothetical protein VGP64_08540 [Polyangia bacterium]
MRHLGWLTVVLLALSCAVDNSNLNVDASGTGTTGGASGSAGTGGAAGVGGCPRCAPTGGSGGAIGSGGAAAGAVGTGGSVTGTGGKGAGGTTGTGGKGAGGVNGTGGQGGAASCDALATEYATELTAAKSCSPGAANQCQQLVDTTLPCAGCKTYVNDATNLNALASQWTAAGCASMQHICPAIACVVPGPSTCQEIATTGGGGPGPSGPPVTTGMCTSGVTPLGAN